MKRFIQCFLFLLVHIAFFSNLTSNIYAQQGYTPINNKNSFCDLIHAFENPNPVFRFFVRNTSPNKTSILIPPSANMFSLSFSRGHGTQQVKAAFRYGSIPQDYLPDWNTFTAVYPPNTHFFSLNDISFEQIIKVGGLGSESYNIFTLFDLNNISQGIFYLNIFSGKGDLHSGSYSIGVNKARTIEWCGGVPGPGPDPDPVTPSTPLLSHQSGTVWNATPQNISVQSANATKIYYNANACGTLDCVPTPPAAPTPSSFNGQIGASSGFVTLKSDLPFTRYSMLFVGCNGEVCSPVTSEYVYTFNLQAAIPSLPAVTPPSWTESKSSPLIVTVQSTNAQNIFYKKNECSTPECLPPIPAEPTPTLYDGQISGSSGSVHLTTTDGQITKYSLRFVGCNANNVCGPVTDGFVYGVDLRHPAPGNLSVSIEPAEVAENELAGWRRLNTVNWYRSGQVEQGVEPGSYVIEFREGVAGWNKPQNISVSVITDQTAAVIGTYQLSDRGKADIIFDWLETNYPHAYPSGNSTVEVMDDTTNTLYMIYRYYPSTSMILSTIAGQVIGHALGGYPPYHISDTVDEFLANIRLTTNTGSLFISQ